MSSVDERVVKMKFDNAEFKKNAADTKVALDSVNKSVDSAGKGRGLMDLNSNMQRVQVSASKMGIATAAALGTIVSKATLAGLSLAKSLTLDPIKSGFHEYESLLTKQNVIMNATGQSAGAVKKVLNDLNKYSDKTIFSFGDMTEALTSFVNAGVPLKKASQAMQGIANASALAGASTQESQSSFRAFSQALGQGFLGLQDWRQAAVTGKIGTVQFKQALIDAAVQAGTLTKRGKEYVTQSGKTLTATKGFDLSLQNQWASTKVLNSALRTYADQSSNLGKRAFKAAQDVRTFSAFMDTFKESLGSGWAQIFTALFGGLNDATKMWTGLSNAVGRSVQNFFNFASAALTTWRALGGAQKVIQGFKNILAPIGAIFSTVGKAWRAAFPNSGQGAGKGLYAVSAGFEAITRPLQLVADLITHLVTPMTIFFQIVKIGASAIKGIIGYVSDFASGLSGLGSFKAPSSGGLLSWLQTLGSAIEDTLGQITALLDKGKSLKDAFAGVHISLPKLPSLPSLSSLGGGDQAKQAKAQVSGLASPLAGISAQMDQVKKGFKQAGSDAKAGASTVQSAAGAIGSALGKVWGFLKNLFDGFSVDDLVASFNMALLSTFIISISRFLNTMSKSFSGFAGSGDAFKKVLESASKGLNAFQTQAKAKLILNIGIAIGILAASLWVLSKIPADQLSNALIAMASVFLMLNHTMKNFGEMAKSFDGKKISLNMFALSVGIVALGLAMILLATAMLIMNKVKWTSIFKGLATMYVAMKLMESLGDQSKAAAKNMVSGAIAIALVAGSMIILAGALLLFKMVDWGSMAKAGVALGGLTLAVAALALIPYEGIAKVGVALLLASVGMEAMASALVMFALVKWASIGKAAVALALLTVSLAILMAVGGPASAAAMLGLAGAMVGLALACLIFNKVDWASIGKAAVVLTILLTALAVGAAIITVFLYAITPIAPVIFVVAAAFALLGLGLLAFAAAMAVAITLGAAGTAAFAALATGAAIAIAVFLQTLASEAPVMKKSFLTILQNLIDTIVEAVPMIIDGIKRLWAAVKKEFTSADKGKATGEAGKSWIQKLGDGIKAKIPMIAAKALEILGALIRTLANNAAKLGGAAANLLAKFVAGVAAHLGGVIASGTALIIAWIRGISSSAVKIANAAADAVIKFIHSMADSIRKKGPKLGDAMGDLGVAMVQGMIGGIGSMANRALDAVGHLASGMVSKAKGIFKSHSPSKVFYDIGKWLVLGMTYGIQDHAASAISATASMMKGQIAVANEYMSKYIQLLDQQALTARGKAQGLAAAASIAVAAAKKTKTKTDDVAAKGLQNQAKNAGKAADAAATKASNAKAAQDAAEAYANKSTLEKAQFRSSQAQNALAAAKADEQAAQRDLTESQALMKQSTKAGLTPAQRNAMRQQAAALRTRSKNEVIAADNQLNAAKSYSAQALALQKQAGDEAAAAFQASYEADAKAAADEAAFNQLSDADKAIERRKQAAELQAQADKDLADAKKLAYSDLEAANALAKQAQDEASQARQYITDAEGYSGGTGGASGGGSSTGTVVNLAASDAAMAMINRNQNLYDAGLAAAAHDSHVEFNQYNTSPEALNPTDVYRKTNNLLTYAAEKIDDAA